MRGIAVAQLLLVAAALGACSTPQADAPTPLPPVSDAPIVVPTDGPRSPQTVLEALWDRDRELADSRRRIAALEAENAKLRAALDRAARER